MTPVRRGCTPNSITVSSAVSRGVTPTNMHVGSAAMRSQSLTPSSLRQLQQQQYPPTSVGGGVLSPHHGGKSTPDPVTPVLGRKEARSRFSLIVVSVDLLAETLYWMHPFLHVASCRAVGRTL